MSRSFIAITAILIVGGGLILLPGVPPTGAQDKKGDADEVKRLKRLNDDLTKELGVRLYQLTDMHAKQEEEAKKLIRRNQALEIAIRAAGAPIPKDAKEEAALIDNQPLVDLLKIVINTKGLQEPVKLKVALEYFSDTFGGKLPIIVDKEAFRVPFEDFTSPYEEEVGLPPVPARMTMAMALQLVLSQVAKGQAAYMIRRGHIEIVPEKYTTSPYFLYQPMISGTFAKQPLANITQELVDQSGVSVDLDPALGKKATTLVSVTYRNVSLEDALTPLTEMAGLKYVVLHRSIYVTTAKTAKVLEAEEEIRRKKREAGPGIKQAPKGKRLESPAD